MLISRRLASFCLLLLAIGGTLTIPFAPVRAAEVGTVLAHPIFTPLAASMADLPNTNRGITLLESATESTLTLTPNQAPCGTPVIARGANFPVGRTVEIAASGGDTKPTGDAPLTVVAAIDGTFALDLMPCTGASPGADLDGAQYVVAASVPNADPFVPPDAFARAVFTVGLVAHRPLPTLTLAPESGACNGPAVAGGASWTPGNILSLTAFPLGGHQGVGFAEVTVGADGTFTLPFELQRATRCSARSAPPLGTQYRISVGPNLKQGSTGLDFASVTYTIARERLTERCFAETGYCVRGTFYDRWEQRGLEGNGYPLSDEFAQTLEDGNEYMVQYFERVRLEYHPENATPDDVLIGQFGRRIVATVPDAPVAPAVPLAGSEYFPETGHNVGPRFMAYWTANGGLAQFGYPLSAPFEQQLEDGKTYTVQYFERARFELHPENAAPYDVLLGQFGRRILAESQR